MKRCPGYGRESHVAPLSDFTRNKTEPDGLQKRCRACQSAATRASRERTKAIPLEVRIQRRADGMKRCYRCPSMGRPAVHPIDDFHVSRNDHDGRRSHCKDCVRELRWEKWGIVGMTVERYDAMLAQQHHRCAIPSCGATGTDERMLDVDHDHATGEARGLLCRNCNIAMGRCRESVAILTEMIVYLTRRPAELREAPLEQLAISGDVLGT